MAYMVKEVTKQWKRGALSLLSATIAAAALVSTPPALAAQTTAATCGVSAKPPYYQNGRVYGQGVAWCNNGQPAIGVVVDLFRDGRRANGSYDTCRNAKTCHETTSYPNSKGNQRWCLRAIRTAPGNSGPSWACENRGF